MHKFASFTLLLISCLLIFSSCIQSRYSPVKKYRDRSIALENFGQSTARNFKLRFLFEGNYTTPNNTLSCVSFTDTKNVQLNQGRILATQLAENFTAFNLSNSVLKQSFQEAFESYSCTESFSDFVLKKLGFRITYWNENLDRPKAPYLAEIQFRDNTFYYYEADPQTQALKLIFEESYENAITFKNATIQPRLSNFMK